MRMLMFKCKLLCPQHANGEAYEIQNKVVPHLSKKRSITGYIKNRLLEPKSIRKRYDELRKDAVSRGWKRRANLKPFSIRYLPKNERNAKVDVEANLKELARRCPECRKRIEKEYRIVYVSDSYIRLFKRRFYVKKEKRNVIRH